MSVLALMGVTGAIIPGLTVYVGVAAGVLLATRRLRGRRRRRVGR